MESDVSVARLLAELEKKVALHRDRQAFHAEQAATHEAQQAFHAAELQRALEHFEALRAAVTGAGEVLAPLPGEEVPQPVAKPEPDELPGSKGDVFAKLVDRIIARKKPKEVFGAKEITRELNQRYAERLGRRADSRTVAQKLRRMALSHRLVRTREGKSFHEALYRRRG
jgi:hypothetical protein